MFSAQCLADQHVVKMTLESTQLVCTALQLRGVTHTSLYRPTHKHHPCTQAAANDHHYFWWVVEHGMALAAEYLFRFKKTHGALGRLELAARVARLKRPYGDLSPARWPMAMPDEFKGDDPHEAYTRYLKAKYATWKTTGSAPRWKRVVPNNPFISTDTTETSILEHA
jgi:hypothetical protein